VFFVRTYICSIHTQHVCQLEACISRRLVRSAWHRQPWPKMTTLTAFTERMRRLEQVVDGLRAQVDAVEKEQAWWTRWHRKWGQILRGLRDRVLPNFPEDDQRFEILP
jgi:hypothetical protein